MRFIYTKTFIKIFTIFVLLSFLVIADARGYTSIVKDHYFRIYNFGAGGLTALTNTVKVSFSTLFTIRKLVAENAELNYEINDLAFENARLKSARDENAVLRRSLSFRQQSELNLLPVEILVSDPTGFSQTVVIDKGEDYGIAINQPIVVQPGLLIGKVTKVYQNSAEVTLITDPNMVVNGEVVDSGARGLVRGEHGLSLSFDLVTQNELIKTGDRVITSGLSNDFPRGLLIGSISGIRSTQTDLFQKAYLSASADLRNIKFLFAIQ